MVSKPIHVEWQLVLCLSSQALHAQAMHAQAMRVHSCWSQPASTVKLFVSLPSLHDHHKHH